MKTNSPRLALMLLGIVSLAACGGYSSGPAGNGDGNLVAGTYTGSVNGTADSQPFTLNVTFTLVQSGDSFNGTFTTNDTGGSASGTVNGLNVTFTINQTSPCNGTFTGAGTISSSGGRITGSYSGTSPCTGPVSAAFVVDRVAGTGPPGY